MHRFVLSRGVSSPTKSSTRSNRPSSHPHETWGRTKGIEGLRVALVRSKLVPLRRQFSKAIKMPHKYLKAALNISRLIHELILLSNAIEA